MNNYRILSEQVQELLNSESDLIANLANISALLYHNLPDINWVGFYLYDFDENELILGPFQGKVACTRIKANQGVCGHSYSTQKTQVVDNVHQFPDHIACDSASNSEIVIPLFSDDEVVAVLDIDSPKLSRFSQEDVELLEEVGDIISRWISTI